MTFISWFSDFVSFCKDLYIRNVYVFDMSSLCHSFSMELERAGKRSLTTFHAPAHATIQPAQEETFCQEYICLATFFTHALFHLFFQNGMFTLVLMNTYTICCFENV